MSWRGVVAGGVAVGVALLALPPAAVGQTPAEVAPRLASEVVYVSPQMEDELPVRAAGNVRLRILRKAIGRIRIAAVPPEAARAVGGVGGYAGELDHLGAVRGALLVTDGASFHVITSHDRPVVEALRAALARAGRRSLERRLVAAVDVIAERDPGAGADLDAAAPQGQQSDPGEVTIGLPDGISNAISGAIAIVAISIGLPFIVVALLLVGRVVSRRRAAARSLADERVTAWDRLHRVAAAVTELEPAGSDPVYAELVERYAEAEALVDVREADARALRRAAAALDAAERAADQLRTRAPSPADGRS